MPSMILAHAGHNHGPDLAMIAMLTATVLLVVWIVISAVRSQRAGSRPTPSKSADRAP